MEEDVNGRGPQWRMTSMEDNPMGITRLLKNNIMEAMQEPDDISLPAYLPNVVLSLAQLSPSLYSFIIKIPIGFFLARNICIK